MNRLERLSLIDKMGTMALLILAALLRSDLTYRTAFVDEAMNIRLGWEILHGIPNYFLRFHMAYAPLTSIPWTLVDQVGGMEAVRGLNALLGVLTVLFVILIARRIYGPLAGYIAGGSFAVFGPAIFISTLGVYDVWSVFFASVAIYLWIVALTDDRDPLLAWGSLAMCVAILAKYTAVVVAILLAGYAAILAIRSMIRHKSGGSSQPGGKSPVVIIKKLVLWGLPFLSMVGYALLFHHDLTIAWNAKTLIMGNQAQEGLRWKMFTEFADYLWAPFLLGLPALFWRKGRVFSLGLLVVGLSLLIYHQVTLDPNQIHKHVNYMAVGLMILASGGIALTAQGLLKRAASGIQRTTIALVGVLVIAYLGVSGQNILPSMRSYWSDTTELVQYLREELKQGEVLLMEGGDVGVYYLMIHGTPGHTPKQIASTWWYEDEQGQGVDALKRSIDNQKFDFVVFDDHFTKQTNDQLREFMADRYELTITFPAHRFGKYGQFEVFTPQDRS